MAPSQLYNQLRETAIELVNSTTFDPTNSSNPIDAERVRAVRAPDYKHNFGHKSAVAGTPLGNTLDADGFVAHLNHMTPMLAYVKFDIQDVLVDEERRAATVRMIYRMSPKAAPEQELENEMLWVLEMDEEGKKVKKATEWLDLVTSGKMREIIQKGQQQQP